MLFPGTILQNRYRIVRELGRGGMGAVYEAIDQRLTSKVALKEMLGARDIHARNAFEREAALLANLNHSNLPRVMDHFSENDGAFLVMQFIGGMDLAEWLDLRGSPFPQPQVLLWADTLLDVLGYLHGHNPPILHRDIKPSNIKRTEDGRLFLLDFGLAKGSVGQMPTYGTTPSVRGGTPYYSPLEQFSGPGTDGRSDLYALGATLYHLISGVLPADAGSRHQAIEDDEPDPLQTLAAFASPNVGAVI
jgi:eukaryotic-like serine/threonine-protein kinase